MKKPTVKKLKDPTLHDVIGMMRDGFTRVENRLDKVENRLGNVEHQVEGLEGEVRNLVRRVGSLEEKVEDMDETLMAVARAVDKDAATLLKHERRITRLEQRRV